METPPVKNNILKVTVFFLVFLCCLFIFFIPFYSTITTVPTNVTTIIEPTILPNTYGSIREGLCEFNFSPSEQNCSKSLLSSIYFCKFDSVVSLSDVTIFVCGFNGWEQIQ